MSGEVGASPLREQTPTFTPPPSIPQKRALDDDHQPAVSSPLNPDFKPTRAQTPQDDTPLARDRAPRTKKESLKKRESKAGTSSGSLGHEGGERSKPDVKTSRPSKKKVAKEVITPQRYAVPPPRSADWEPQIPPTFISSHTKIGPDGQEIQYNAHSDPVYNKKGFRYTLCIADPEFPRSSYFRRTETLPAGPSLSLHDISTHMYVDESACHVTTDKGFRMVKGNVCARFGRWYWECKITSGIPGRRNSDSGAEKAANGHVRMGWARREATLDAPVGYDAYSYALRDVGGQKVFMSRPKDFFPVGEDIREGDVIGLEINLPSENLHRKVVEGHYNPAVDLADDEKPGLEAGDIIRDRLPIHYKNNMYFEQVEYYPAKELQDLMNPSPVIASTGGIAGSTDEPYPNHPLPALRTLPHSSITIYKNGKPMGAPFKDLLAFLPPASKPQIDKTQVSIGAREGLDDGTLGYYPAVSVFRGGAAEVNFGPDFWYPPPGYEIQGDDVDMVDSDHPPQNKKGDIRAISERFDEQIVEDVVFDVIDEVDFWIADGMPDTSVTAGSGPRNGAGLGLAGSGGFKELVQDDE